MSSARGAWDGSNVDEEYVECLLHRRKLPPAELVVACIAGEENTLTAQAGEVVVFAEHFARGLGLPSTNFIFWFLTHFGLQTHHLSANAVLQLAAFITLCEGFLRIES
ncbi:hypothetical protein D1007_26254 [Hordeum vulgare]|nr:hypothetical protein D1007_26254 [Hordeum vulgare]